MRISVMTSSPSTLKGRRPRLIGLCRASARRKKLRRTTANCAGCTPSSPLPSFARIWRAVRHRSMVCMRVATAWGATVEEISYSRGLGTG
jgi:hypothetical protein